VVNIVVLADGTKVWLNAASSLYYPTAFTGRERRVEFHGEAYFEVAKNAAQPFIVTTNKSEIKVLGTHFNINAYENEQAVKTTLLEGAVQVSTDTKTAVLKPGEQAIVSGKDPAIHVMQTDTDAAIAWKNGWFLFDKADIETIMKQLERWYDVEVMYAGEISKDHYTGQVPRNAKLSEVLKMLELSQTHFKIDGKKITVLQ
jgi:ferric-dicitrate binding protein FerR (iron transport regulator)